LDSAAKSRTDFPMSAGGPFDQQSLGYQVANFNWGGHSDRMAHLSRLQQRNLLASDKRLAGNRLAGNRLANTHPASGKR
jgi:hypothetical protein